MGFNHPTVPHKRGYAKCRHLFVNDIGITRTTSQLRAWYWREQALACGLVVLVFTVTGPFQTYPMAFWQRALYWFLNIGSGWAFLIAALAFVLRHPRLDNWPMVGRSALAMLLALVPTFLAIWWVHVLMRGGSLNATLVFNITFVYLLIGSTMIYRVRTRLGQTGGRAAPAPVPFLDRLPAELGRDLVSLSMQDHYVEATTSKGTTLILMRFGDALDELANLDGYQIHRSHWIAAAALGGVQRQGSSLTVTLTDGRSLPVSRTYAPTIRKIAARKGKADA